MIDSASFPPGYVTLGKTSTLTVQARHSAGFSAGTTVSVATNVTKTYPQIAVSIPDAQVKTIQSASWSTLTYLFETRVGDYSYGGVATFTPVVSIAPAPPGGSTSLCRGCTGTVE